MPPAWIHGTPVGRPRPKRVLKDAGAPSSFRTNPGQGGASARAITGRNPSTTLVSILRVRLPVAVPTAGVSFTTASTQHVCSTDGRLAPTSLATGSAAFDASRAPSRPRVDRSGRQSALLVTGNGSTRSPRRCTTSQRRPMLSGAGREQAIRATGHAARHRSRTPRAAARRRVFSAGSR